MPTITGCLSPGIHEPADWSEFESRFGYNLHRRKLLAGLKTALYLLAEADCKVVYVNGSFVTTKEFPGDIDACWETDGIDWDRLAPIFTDFADHRAAQKARFGCEFFPADWRADHTGRTFLEFFQQDRDGTPKGIVRLDLERLL